MSYLRWAWSHKYVNGKSNDYIFEDGRIGYIEDYGDITNEGLTELLCRCIVNSYGKKSLITKYLMKKLSKRLNVKLRKEPLTDKQIFDIMMKEVKKMNEKEIR